jgi:hypothetical protein
VYPLIYFNPATWAPDPDKAIIPANDPVIDEPAAKKVPPEFTGMFGILLV